MQANLTIADKQVLASGYCTWTSEHHRPEGHIKKGTYCLCRALHDTV